MKTPALSNVMKVARWELIKHIKSPVFLVLTFLIPLIMLIVAGITYFSEQASRQEAIRLGVADRTDHLSSHLEEYSEGTPLTLVAIQAETGQFDRMIREENLDGILLVEKESLETGNLTLYVQDARDLSLANFRSIIDKALASYRMIEMGLDPQEIEAATAPAVIRTRTITGDEPGLADFLLPLAAGMALIFAAMFSGQILMYGVIKEKRSRVVEILLSSISSLELLMGKIAGFGALSICQIVIWLGSGLIVALLIAELPAVDLSAGQVIPPLLFFVFGFLMLSSIFAAVGATMKEAEGGSQAQGMIILIPLIPLFIATPLLMNPNAGWARILSHVPPFIPTTVLLRMGGTTLPTWEIVSTLSALIIFTALFIYLGAKIFEGTILQYDRAAGWRDIKTLFSKKTVN